MLQQSSFGQSVKPIDSTSGDGSACDLPQPASGPSMSMMTTTNSYHLKLVELLEVNLELTNCSHKELHWFYKKFNHIMQHESCWTRLVQKGDGLLL